MYYLKLNDKTIDATPLQGVLTQGEQNADTAAVVLPKMHDGIDQSVLTFTVYGTTRTGAHPEYSALAVPIGAGSELLLLWRITADFTAEDGPLALELRGFDGGTECDPVIIYPMGTVKVRPSGQSRLRAASQPESQILDEARRAAAESAQSARSADAALDKAKEVGIKVPAYASLEELHAAQPNPPRGALAIAGGYFYYHDGTAWQRQGETGVLLGNYYDKAAVDAELGNKANITEVCRPNLFINGDFSIWQRGTSFDAPGYTADGWINATQKQSTVRVEKISTGLKAVILGMGGGGSNIGQVIEFPERYAGKTLTLAIDCYTTGSYRAIYIGYAPEGQETVYRVAAVQQNQREKVVLTVEIPLGIARLECGMGLIRSLSQSDAGTYTEMYTAKLEVGERFMGFYPSDPATELARCQRYQLALVQYQIWRAAQTTGNYIDFNVETPTTLRIHPVLTNQNFIIAGYGSGVADGFIYSIAAFSQSSVRIRATKSAHGLTDAHLEVPVVGAILDANL